MDWIARAWSRGVRQSRLIRTGLVGLALGAGPYGVAATELEIRFVGNAAFEITDGETTLLSDFPYRPGAFGYMTYPQSELSVREGAICLISHGHADHFEADRVGGLGCHVAGPADVLAQVPEDRRLSWRQHRIEMAGVAIQAIDSPHVPELGHYSYRVEWQGLSLYFTGDTETLEQLEAAGRVDLLFVTPWLARLAGDQRLSDYAERVVIYHHAAGEEPACGVCEVPTQGQVLSLGD